MREAIALRIRNSWVALYASRAPCKTGVSCVEIEFAIFMSNTAVTPVAVFGTLFAGGVIVVINPETKEEKLAYLIEDAQATALVTEGPLARIFAPVVADRRTLRTVLCAEPPQGADVESFEAVLEATPAEPMANCTIPFDLAALIYTSGSTGLPKGVMMTHLSMVFSVASISEYLRLGENDRILGLLPLAFDYGLYQLLMSIRLGSTLFLERSFAFPAHIIRRVEEEAITIFPGVPTVYATLLSIHGRSPLALTSVRRVTNTAAALLPAMHAGLREIFPNALIFAMYGLTECKRVCYLEPEMLELEALFSRKSDPRNGDVCSFIGWKTSRSRGEWDPARTWAPHYGGLLASARAERAHAQGGAAARRADTLHA